MSSQIGSPAHKQAWSSVYLDHAATTPMLPSAVSAMCEQLSLTGNASSLHSRGRAARRVVEESREAIATALDARPSEVIFTAGGTEANNLAIKGLFWSRRTGHPERTRIVISTVEHHAVLDPVLWLAEHAGAELVQLPVDSDGVLDRAALEEEFAINAQRIALVSVMWANNEVGALQPIADVVRVAHSAGVPVHSDAVAAVGAVDVDFGASGLDALTFSGHKIGGPVGVGALLARRELALVPVLHGGGQERGVRSGTLDVAAIRALGVAVQETVAGLPDSQNLLVGLRQELIAGVLAAIPDARLCGPDPAVVPSLRLPGNVHFIFSGCEGDSLLYLLDSAGISCSTGSACRAGVPQPSHVLLAMGVDEEQARGALRFSLGHTSSQADVGALLGVLPGVVERARSAGLVTDPGIGGH